MSGGSPAGGVPTVGRREWNEEYRRGRWRYLGEPDEAARYQAIVARILTAGATEVLDLGCGEGLLARHLETAGFTGRYVGVDWAHSALPPTGGPNRRFVCANLAQLPVRGQFAVVVLSEVLYYLDDPDRALAEALALVAPAGELVVSLYRPAAERHPGWHSLISDLATRLAGLAGDQGALIGSAGHRRWSMHVVTRLPNPGLD
ncbi:class I SAM-dependent methyltransferase [Plantactinospora sp. S1510]|uniref:Class I SAM-dependent methyltransferase n=1 Tax=Plantactinospora alkalitolerans TaxID=2789879 RepID=A0ABS0H184_9ACTN|nr:class I SAM-dependent methyltransferase [Plantactinospora alkalitolerans]MBF9132216.1 class I SAM-dependent methyltransferase [Plantactinospora alkalitolerans]